jgi:outer membrane protein assembly factor BamB
MILLALTTLAPALPNDDWPEFKGPNRTSVVEAVDSDFDWGEDGPEIVWVTPTGPGYGGVAVHGGEVILLDREVGESDILRVFALATGEELWSADYPAEGRLNFAGSRTVPSVQEDMIITAGGMGHVAGFDRAEKKMVWNVDLEEMFDGRPPMFGWSASPLVLGELVIVTPLGEHVGLVALDRKTGEERWFAPTVGFSHSTPTLLELNGRQQLLFMSTLASATGQDASAPTMISSYNPKTGDRLWDTEIELSRLPIPGPVRIDDEHILVTGGYRAGTTLLRILRDGGRYDFEELFHIERGAQTHAPVLKDEHVYLLANENWNYQARKAEGGLMCISLDGEEKWRTKDDPYFGRGNMILAGGHLLIQDGFNGVLRIVRASPDGYELVAEANVFEKEGRRDEQMWAPMALAGGLLLMRSQDELRCVKL